MPTFRQSCDLYQGYNFKKDKQTSVGFVTALRLGDTDLHADQTCQDPMSPSNDIVVVAVLSDVLWECGVTDAVYFSGQISAANRQAVLGLLYNTTANVRVTCAFDAYAYDPLAKRYFTAFTSAGAPVSGALEKHGDDLNLSVADDASTEVQSPANYSLTVGIKPGPSAQPLTIATSATSAVIKPWGRPG